MAQTLKPAPPPEHAFRGIRRNGVSRAMPLARLRDEEFSTEIIETLNSVTRREGETYEDFVKRAGQNPVGRHVKLSDLQDNCDLSRIGRPGAKDHERIARYRRAIAYIESLSQRNAGA